MVAEKFSIAQVSQMEGKSEVRDAQQRLPLPHGPVSLEGHSNKWILQNLLLKRKSFKKFINFKN